MLPPSNRPADDPRNGPVILRRDYAAQGLNDRAVTRRIREEGLVRLRRGAYVSPDVWSACDEVGRFGLLGRAALRQAVAHVVLSHSSALVEYGAPLWGFDLSIVHVTRTDGLSGRRGPDLVQHQGRMGPGDLVVLNGVPVMNPARAALESATLGSLEAALCVANFLLNSRLMTMKELIAQYVDMENWPDTRPIELLLRLADPRVESIGESRFFFCCFQQGLPAPQPQYPIRDAAGRVVFRVDFAWPDLGLFVEFDGKIKYEKLLKEGERASDVVLRERDRERKICELTGWRCIRVTWADLANSTRLAATIRAELFRPAA
ncbi:Transcriptional regulator, AbiEi antitoxin, Type IV TA system [Nocardioides szechwanensis]|uniref:Transcriptional regulator, AbiEi antitoxin, Type IV TA system n=2 Tax=Nocardioides szechwanensis TaxID=1005944 RepID=A0A1G9WYL0_9ACTN|nr:Transcriptional regulator, AbiEi antitoxin, Type IV TA system [Nocardioides szechwanensis]